MTPPERTDIQEKAFHHDKKKHHEDKLSQNLVLMIEHMQIIITCQVADR